MESNKLTGFEVTQELPLSDKDIQLIIDIARHAQKSIYRIFSENAFALNEESKDWMTKRLEAIQRIIDKLNGTPAVI